MHRILAAVLLLAVAAPVAAGEMFVAVGYGGRRLVSRDGVTWDIAAEWSDKGGDDGNNLLGLAFGHGKFVAVGGGGAGPTGAGHVVVSKDGKTWRGVYTAKSRIAPVAFGNGRFVAGGPNRQLLWSADGETWKPGGQLDAKEATHFRQCAFGNDTFVFIGNRGGNTPQYWAATSADGTKVTSLRIDLPAVRGFAFGGDRFVAVGPDGLRMSSVDGREWEKAPTGDGDELTWVVWTGKAFLCGGSKATYTSADGKAWAKGESRFLCGLLWSDGTRGIGSTWPGQMWHSADMAKWEKAKPLPPNGINHVVRGVAD